MAVKTEKNEKVKQQKKTTEQVKKQGAQMFKAGNKAKHFLYTSLEVSERLIEKLTDLYQNIFVGDDKKKILFYREQGLNYFDQGKYKKAIESLMTYLEDGNVEDVDALFYLGVSCANMDKTVEAIGYLTKAEVIQNDDADIIAELASCFAKTEQYLQAMKYYKKAIKLNPDFADNHYFLGVSYEKTENLENAIPMYKKAIELKPRDPLFYQALGFAYESSEKHNDAITCFKKAMELEKNR